jgi:aminopeptidase N
MIEKILTVLVNIFQNIQTPIVPNKIGFNQMNISSNYSFRFNLDILAVPEYPSDAVSHWGFIIFTELALLHDPSTTSELDTQRIALLIAKELAEQVRI